MKMTRLLFMNVESKQQKQFPKSLQDYLKQIRLPNKTIKPIGETSRLFLSENIKTLWHAIQYVQKLPYRRTTDRANYFQVLIEKRGACSTKHALIAALAKELSIPLKLNLGIFLLTPQNTPKIALVLESYCFKAIPEAHCYLKYNKKYSTLLSRITRNVSLMLT